MKEEKRVAGRPEITTVITDNNGGMHSTEAYCRMKEMLENNTYRDAHLYHLVLRPIKECEYKPTIQDYQGVIKTFCLKLSRSGILHKWRACVELDEEKELEGKGLHMHIFIMIEGKTMLENGKEFNTSKWFDMKEGKWLPTMLSARNVDLHIAKPKSKLHGGGGLLHNCHYATLPKSNPEKIADCIEWISYLCKVRSKIEYSPTHKTTYFSSRDKKAIAL
jgi:hypothetical protein